MQKTAKKWQIVAERKSILNKNIGIIGRYHTPDAAA